MIITIHRGENQIGGSIIEITAGGTNIFLDCGAELNEENPALPPQVKARLESGEIAAVFFSHAHLDHTGLAGLVPEGIPLYIGEKALHVMRAMGEYAPMLEPRAEYRTFKGFCPVEVGGLTVTPIPADHSSFDSYMLLVSDGAETVLYSGDFRAHGRQSYDSLLRRLPGKIDTLICEGTTLGSDTHGSRTEDELAKEMEALLNEHTGPAFLLCSGSNPSRVATAYKAALRAGRMFFQDTYTAKVCAACASADPKYPGYPVNIPNPFGSFQGLRVFQVCTRDHELLAQFPGEKRIARSAMSREKFVMVIRPNRYFHRMLEKMKSEDGPDFTGGLLIYSMWSGYKHPKHDKDGKMQAFLQACTALGLWVVDLHTSGHADETAIRRLIERVNSGRILPVHTENAGWFGEEYPR